MSLDRASWGMREGDGQKVCLIFNAVCVTLIHRGRAARCVFSVVRLHDVRLIAQRLGCFLRPCVRAPEKNVRDDQTLFVIGHLRAYLPHKRSPHISGNVRRIDPLPSSIVVPTARESKSALV